MKNVLFTLLVHLCFSYSFAQKQADVYCAIEMPSSFFNSSKGLVVTVDYGTVSTRGERPSLKDSTGKVLLFFSSMQVVNLMSQQGWALHSVSPTLPVKASLLNPTEYSQSLFIFQRKEVAPTPR